MYYNNNTVIFLNGSFEKASSASTNLFGQTLHYGYGVFEGIRSYQTEKGVQIFKAKEHYERLKQSCKLMNIPFNYDTSELIAQTYDLLKKNNLSDAYIRPLIFCDPNMSLTRPKAVSIMICAWEWGAYWGDQQLNIMISSFCRPHPRSTNIEAKTCGHYVNSILASTEAKDKGYDEALLLDCKGYLAEGPGANLFFEKEGILFTPKKGNILPGITRETILEICKKRTIEVKQGLFKPKELKNADAAFYCGTAAEVVGIASIDGTTLKKEWNQSLGKIISDDYKSTVQGKELLSFTTANYGTK